ncbi:MAG: hypothetical protein AAF548_05845 [Actinomycetota bacterium]
MGWLRGLQAAVLVVVMVGVAAPAGAQDDPAPAPAAVTVLDDAEEARPESAVVRDDETSDTVRRIRRDLLVVGSITGVALVIYLWHTSPRRRLRIAADRLADVDESATAEVAAGD